MTLSITRRAMLAGALALPAFRLLAGAAARAGGAGPLLGAPEPFAFDRLIGEARALAAAPYRPAAVSDADVLDAIDFDAYQKIRYRPEATLWPAGEGPYPVRLFHLGRYFKEPVRIYLVENGQAREVRYSTAYFDFGGTGFDARLFDDLGFAGFRVMERDRESDWLAFLGASYFRSSGELDQYGLSARGLAIDTALPTPEEFPRFTAFWLEPAPDDPEELVINALLDGPSVSGAYRIEARKDKAVVMTIRAELFARKDIARMGIAPLTSMFWFAENDRHLATDWRPEIHDSDGLALWTGAGERIWRPLNNPPAVMTNAFADENPRGFGLLQRDRDFDHYQDDGVFYDRRPSVWVEPLEPWGRGAVQLVEIPTDDEIHDNVVAYWVPEAPIAAGSSWSFRYRLHWRAQEPFPPTAGRVVATRIGRGGVPGQPRPKGRKKFVIDFEGGPLDRLAQSDPVEAAISASRGAVDNDYTLKVVGTKRWRAFFDLAAEGRDPVNLRCYLRLGGEILTETWLYQYVPFDFAPECAGGRGA